MIFSKKKKRERKRKERKIFFKGNKKTPKSLIIIFKIKISVYILKIKRLFQIPIIYRNRMSTCRWNLTTLKGNLGE